jgi:predicted DsbA family dithiol-disulfide isomerase
MSKLKIEIYSDLICPWCYIGKRRMQAGLKLLGSESSPEIIWRPFQLNPGMPSEGMDRKTYRSRKFGSWERSQAMDDNVASIGRSIGIGFHYDRVLVTPNTMAGHRMLWWAKQRKRQHHLAEALFHAYFTEGRDIGRHDVLAEVASEVGLPKDEAHAFLDGDEGRKEVALEEMAGRSLSLDGVPFFVVNGRPAFSGAQNPQTFVEAFRYVLGGNMRQSGADSCEV